MERIIWEPARRPNTFFFHAEDGFFYNKTVSREKVVYFKCVQCELGNYPCKGRALYRQGVGFAHTKNHNHEPDVDYAAEMAMRRACLDRCKNLDYTSFKKIIQEEGRGLTSKGVARQLMCKISCVGQLLQETTLSSKLSNMTVHIQGVLSLRYSAEVRSRVTVDNMRSCMRRARLDNFPPPPANLQQLTELLQDPNYRIITMTEDGADNIYGGSVTDVDGFHHVTFISDGMLRFMASCRVLHSDGTFKTLPSGLQLRLNRQQNSSQVFVILTSWRNTALPLAWVIMERRTQNAYEAVLGFLRTRMLQFGLQINTEFQYTDFETGMMNAWQNIFHIDPQGCLYHLCRAFVVEAITLGLAWHLINNEEVRRIVRISCALALLPVNMMRRGLVLLIREARDGGQDNILRPYFRYLFDYWVGNDVRKRRMCVWKSKRRTNNVCESHNSTLRDSMGIHPNIYHFISTLVHLEARTHRDIVGLSEGRRVARKRRTSAINNDDRLQNLAADLDDPPDNMNDAIWRYMRRASRVMQNAFDEAAGEVE